MGGVGEDGGGEAGGRVRREDVCGVGFSMVGRAWRFGRGGWGLRVGWQKRLERLAVRVGFPG